MHINLIGTCELCFIISMHVMFIKECSVIYTLYITNTLCQRVLLVEYSINYVIQHVHSVFHTVSNEVHLTPTICTIPLAIIFSCGVPFLVFLVSLKGQQLISVALLLCAIIGARGKTGGTFSSHVTRHIGWDPCHLSLDNPAIPTVRMATLIH